MPKEFDAHIFDGLRAGIRKTVQQFPAVAGREGVDFMRGNFDAQAWRGQTTLPWPKRNPIFDTDPTRKTLFKRGILKNACTVLRKTADSVTIGVDAKAVPYAEIHNTGGTIQVTVTPKLRKWAWAMYYKHVPKEGGRFRASSGRTNIHTGSSRISRAASIYKGIALTKKQKLTIKMPKRQYVGPSPVLDKMILDKLAEVLAINTK